jgi:hypothetical protein
MVRSEILFISSYYGFKSYYRLGQKLGTLHNVQPSFDRHIHKVSSGKQINRKDRYLQLRTCKPERIKLGLLADAYRHL